MRSQVRRHVVATVDGFIITRCIQAVIWLITIKLIGFAGRGVKAGLRGQHLRILIDLFGGQVTTRLAFEALISLVLLQEPCV